MHSNVETILSGYQAASLQKALILLQTKTKHSMTPLYDSINLMLEVVYPSILDARNAFSMPTVTHMCVAMLWSVQSSVKVS